MSLSQQTFRESSPRMLVLGLDAADPTLIQEWTDKGDLPALNRLRQEGSWIALSHDGTIPSASVWPSIYTGTQPGKHGIYNSVQWDSARQKVNRVNPSKCPQPPFWRILDKSGKRAVVMDVPFNYPLYDFRGAQILDWGTYERNYEACSLPGELLAEISRRFGAYPFGEEMSRDAPVTARHFSRVRAQLLAGAQLKGKVVRWLMSSRPWDFLLAVFAETHPAGHYFWGFQSNGRSAVFSEFENTIKEVYRAVDEEIGKIAEMLDGDCALLVVSGQGMGPNDAQWHLIPRLLTDLGFLVTETKSDQRGGRTHWLGEARDFIPLQWRRSVSRYLPGGLRDQLRCYWALSSIDWSRTRAFCLPTDLLGYVRINLKGREPQGIVEPGPQYDEVCQQIGSALKELSNPQTGQRIVRDVFRASEIFAGSEADRLPDLIVTWQGTMERSGEHAAPTAGDNRDIFDPRAGNHKPQGFALLYGPGIRQCRPAEGHVVDIAPTVLNYFGFKPSCDIDGRPFSNMISD